MIWPYLEKNVAVLFGTLFWTAIAIFAVPVSLHADSWSKLARSVAFVLIIFVFFALLIQKALKCQVAAGKEEVARLTKPWLGIAGVLLCAVVWSMYGIIFYPGLISWDIYVQWHEMSGTLPRSDWHPFFHTCIIWLLTRLWYSPAVIALAQILSMSVAVGMAARSLQRIRVSDWIILLVILFYAFLPLNGFYAVSLWKDIGYSISFLWLTALVIDVVSSDGKILTKRSVFIQIFIALYFIALMRHNGIVPVFGLLFILAVFYRRSQLKLISALSIVLIVCIVFFRGPILKKLDVDIEKKNILKLPLLIQHVGAVLNTESKFTLEEKLFLSRIIPLHYWKNAYNPLSCMPLYFGKDENGKGLVNEKFFKKKENYNNFISVWRRVIAKNYYSIIKYYLTATELVWRIRVPYGIFVIPDEGLTVDDLYFSYKPSSPLREQTGKIGKFLIKVLFNPATGWFMYRGAIYFWMSLFSLSMTFFRSRKYAVLVIAAPMILQVITVAAFPLVQDTRFMFPVILTAPVLIAIYVSPEFIAVNQQSSIAIS